MTNGTTQLGFTFLELVIGVAVIALLAGTIAPLVGGTVELARIERAQTEVEVLGRAVQRFHDTVGSWPARAANGSQSIRRLVSGDSIPGAAPWLGSTAWDGDFAAGLVDTMHNQLRDNRPGGNVGAAWPSTGSYCWLGPYLFAAPLDPWRRPYVVTVYSGYATDPTAHRGVWVLSAGPDGVMQTSSFGLADRPAGDDIGWLVRFRYP